MQGLFINFEGIDGSGTSTQVQKLSERIESLDKYQDVLRTHEPWRNDGIKRKLREDSELYSDGLEMAELFVEDREAHTKILIKPNINKGVVVLNSRYKMSTCAYQWTQGIPFDVLLRMHEGRGILTPDLTFFLDVPIKIAQERVRRRDDNIEKFERDFEFIGNLIKNYNSLYELSQKNPKLFGRVIRINSNREIDDVSQDIFHEFLDVYALR